MASPTFQLIMRSGPTPEKVFELNQGMITIGRDYSNGIVINDVEVSRKHSRLTATSGSYIVEDMGSTNGTFVNGQRLLGPHLLRPGEIISFGEKVTLSFEVLQFDPNATVVAPVKPPPYPAPSYDNPAASPPVWGQPNQPVPPYPAAAQSVPPPSQVVQPQPVHYSGQVPESPSDAELPVEKSRGSRTWIILGVGCLLVFLCVCVGSALVFDTLNLYCIPPFGSFFNWLYTCP